MDLKGGTPYWFVLHGLRTVVPPLDRDVRCDVAVIGSGITGALVAERLTRDGAVVAMIDSRDVAQGSTMASTALLQYDLDVPLHKLERSLGTTTAGQAFQLGVEAINRLEAISGRVGGNFARSPSLYVLRDSDELPELEAEFRSRRRAGLEVEWLDREALLARWQVHACAGIQSAVGATVDPYDLTHRLLGEVIRRGGLVYDRTRVISMRAHAAGVELQTDRGAVVRADHVVNACGYEAASDLDPRMIQLVSTFALISEPVDTLPASSDCLLWEYADPYLYARWTDRRLLMGGEDVDFTDAAARDRLIPTKVQALIDKYRLFDPSVRIEPAFAWAGTFATTADGLGFIGPVPGNPRVLYALGFGGNGITFSMLAADMLADTIAGVRVPELELFRLDRSAQEVSP